MIDENKLKSCPKKVLICRIKTLENLVADCEAKAETLETALKNAKLEYELKSYLLVQDCELQIAKLKKGGAK